MSRQERKISLDASPTENVKEEVAAMSAGRVRSGADAAEVQKVGGSEGRVRSGADVQKVGTRTPLSSVEASSQIWSSTIPSRRG